MRLVLTYIYLLGKAYIHSPLSLGSFESLVLPLKPLLSVSVLDFGPLKKDLTYVSLYKHLLRATVIDGS